MAQSLLWCLLSSKSRNSRQLLMSSAFTAMAVWPQLIILKRTQHMPRTRVRLCKCRCAGRATVSITTQKPKFAEIRSRRLSLNTRHSKTLMAVREFHNSSSPTKISLNFKKCGLSLKTRQLNLKRCDPDSS
jgi:hypothetical protein